MSEELINLHARLDRQDTVLQEIKGAIVGNAALGHTGLVTRMNGMEAQMADHNAKLLVATGAITAGSIFAQIWWKKLLGN